MSEAIIIKTELLAAIAQYACTDESRPNICNVAFLPGEIVATNGHMLVRAKHNTKGHSFGVPRAVVFAAVAAQDALARHFSDYALRLGVDLEAGTDGDSVVTEVPHGNREVLIWPEDECVWFDIGSPVCLRAPRKSVDNFPKVDAVMVAGQTDHSPFDLGFDTSYIDSLDRLARASGYFHRGVRCVGVAGKAGPAEWVIPSDADNEDDSIRVVIMPMRSTEELQRRLSTARRMRT